VPQGEMEFGADDTGKMILRTREEETEPLAFAHAH
jgi:hypothetical protein